MQHQHEIISFEKGKWLKRGTIIFWASTIYTPQTHAPVGAFRVPNQLRCTYVILNFQLYEIVKKIKTI